MTIKKLKMIKKRNLIIKHKKNRRILKIMVNLVYGIGLLTGYVEMNQSLKEQEEA